MQIHPCDNVEVREDGQKYALSPIKAGENVIKYGFPIGHATKDSAVGEQVSPKNLRSNLSGTGDWTYTPSAVAEINTKSGTFLGYVRKNGDAALFAYSKRFDKAELSALEVTQEEFDAAFASLSPELRAAMELAAENIRSFQSGGDRNRID